jgi:citrate synthase
MTAGRVVQLAEGADHGPSLDGVLLAATRLVELGSRLPADSPGRQQRARGPTVLERFTQDVDVWTQRFPVALAAPRRRVADELLLAVPEHRASDAAALVEAALQTGPDIDLQLVTTDTEDARQGAVAGGGDPGQHLARPARHRSVDGRAVGSSRRSRTRVASEIVTETDVTLRYPGGELPLPVVEATEGADGLDVGKLLSTTGKVDLDIGFVNTASCTSAITYIDGDAGILRYRGYPIDQLAGKASFVEVSYLLIYGELPTADQLGEFDQRIRRHTLLHEDLKMFFNGFPRDAHPMPVLSSAVSALSTFYQDSLDPFDEKQVEISTLRLLAKLPTIAAYAYKKSVGQPFLYPDNSHGLVENFLRMTFGLPAEPYEVDPDLVKALDMLFVLHADHEQNCSTSTVRLVGSSQANMFASVSAGINALFGPLHGGANQSVLEMLEAIQRDGGDINRFVERVKNKEPGVKLMGFGHRVYKNYDPRATIVKSTADTVLDKLGGNNELLDLARQLEEIALKDDFFIERKLYPNVDFYTGLIYRAMGFPTRMFTVLFAIGRLPGWIAQWREMIADPTTKIGRPRQVYVGETERNFIPLDRR